MFFAGEGHVEPRRILPRLRQRLIDLGVGIHFETEHEPANDGRITVDCRGLAARDTAPSLRGIKGEMIVVETTEIALSRPVRLLHPRWPLYIVPREDNRFMIGATSIESEDRGVSVRSALELLSAAYAVHPAFGEARIVEIGAGCAPPSPTTCRGSTSTAADRSQRALPPRLPARAGAGELTAAYVERGEIDNQVMRCA